MFAVHWFPPDDDAPPDEDPLLEAPEEDPPPELADDDEELPEVDAEEEAFEEEPPEEEPPEEEALEEEALDEEALDEEALDEEALDEEALDEEPPDEEALPVVPSPAPFEHPVAQQRRKLTETGSRCRIACPLRVERVEKPGRGPYSNVRTRAQVCERTAFDPLKLRNFAQRKVRRCTMPWGIRPRARSGVLPVHSE
jgi:hypothetical protein